jgi:hypothetical protein
LMTCDSFMCAHTRSGLFSRYWSEVIVLVFSLPMYFPTGTKLPSIMGVFGVFCVVASNLGVRDPVESQVSSIPSVLRKADRILDKEASSNPGFA